MNKNILGETDSYFKSNDLVYAPELLFAIPRSENRKKIYINEKLPFIGWDRWNAYEFSWLDQKGKPQVACLTIDIPSDSCYIVESKSLKLYLNSFTFKKFVNINEVIKLVSQDLKRLLLSDVKIKAISLNELSESAFVPQKNLGTCLDSIVLEEEIDYSEPSFSEVNNKFIYIENEQSNEILSTNLFRSLCPVTSQPDWASIVIEYQGRKINHPSLLRYLLSFRKHQGFHEDCVERIFCDLNQICSPDKLSVYAAFTRRGGIDINPFRSNFQNQIPFARFSRQ